MGSILAHKKMIMIMLVVFALLATATFFIIGPNYRAQAILEVYPTYVSNLGDNKELNIPDYSNFVNNQIYNIKSYDVQQKAISILDSKALEKVGYEEVQKLSDQLVVTPISQTYKIVISLSGKNVEGLSERVNAVVKAYLEKVDQEKFVNKEQRVLNLMKRRTELQSEMQDLLRRQTELMDKSGVVSFLDSANSTLEDKIMKLSEGLALAKKEREESEMKLKNFSENARQEFANRIDLLVEEQLEADSYLLSLREVLNQQKVALIAQTVGTNSAHPGRSSSRKTIAEIEKSFELAKAELREQVKEKLKKFNDDRISLSEAVLSKEFAKAKAEELTAEQNLQRVKESTSSYSLVYNSLVSIRSKMSLYRSRIQKIEERLDFFRTEENAPGFVSVFSMARTPEFSINEKNLKISGALFAIGFFLAFLLPLAIDFFNPLMSTPAEIEEAFGYPSLGWLVENKEHYLEDFYINQIRRLALSLIQEKKSQEHRLISVTSIKPCAGSTTLVLALARQLEDLGYSALAVETNALKPSFPDSDNQKGLNDFLSGQERWESVIEGKTADLPARINLGTPSEHPYIHCTADFVHSLKHNEYDFVLMDLPPILMSSDSEYLCTLADAVIVVAEAGRVMPGEVGRLLNTMERLQPEAVAYVVNRVKISKNKGYFNSMVEEFNKEKNSSALNS
ncbi:MAG: hypothetical protein HQL32_07335 [Planctomycetes bacterium]|nr:hypothetical protein [Planctomycetota bacterium]